MRIEDVRRLTGPNLLGPGPLVLTELVLDAGETADAVVALWRGELARFRAAVGLTPVEPQVPRAGPGWVAVVFEAPLDEMMADAEAAEWAGLSTIELLGGRPALPLEPKRTEVAAILEKDRNPRLLELELEARRRVVPFLWDDDEVSLGHGRRSVTYPLHALPEPSTIDWSRLGAVPVALVTGTNGKTTSSRLLARMVAESGRRVGLSCSDGVSVGLERVREGDWTGPGAARLVLRHREVEFAVMETARGGILRRGLACDACDAALLTNVSDDHLSTFGIENLDGMAEVKAVVARSVRPGGVVVLNARDARLMALAPRLNAEVILFADLEHDASAEAAVADHLELGGRALVARGGEIVELNGKRARSLLPIASVPITFRGAARYNVENALGATATAMGLGISHAAIVRALEGFGSADNPGRGETHDRGGVTLFLDYAHNPEGVAAALAVARTLRRGSAGRLFVITGSAGDRTEREIESICAAIHAAGTAGVFLRELAGYLRGREPGVMPALFRRFLVAHGFQPAAITDVGSEVAGLEAALREARRGDVIALLAHVEREAVRQWLTPPPLA